MKDPDGRHYQHDQDYRYDQDDGAGGDRDAADAQHDMTLLDELFGAAPAAADVDPDDPVDAADPVAPIDPDDVVDDLDTDGGVDEPPVPVPRRHSEAATSEAATDSVALAQPGLARPGLVGWARSGVRPATAPGCREIGLTTTGFVIFMIVDSIMMYAPFRADGSTNLLPQAITLALLAFGLGALMIWSIRGACRPVGVGMMLGWVFMTLISAGYFTGLNP